MPLAHVGLCLRRKVLFSDMQVARPLPLVTLLGVLRCPSHSPICEMRVQRPTGQSWGDLDTTEKPGAKCGISRGLPDGKRWWGFRKGAAGPLALLTCSQLVRDGVLLPPTPLTAITDRSACSIQGGNFQNTNETSRVELTDGAARPCTLHVVRESQTPCPRLPRERQTAPHSALSGGLPLRSGCSPRRGHAAVTRSAPRDGRCDLDRRRGHAFTGKSGPVR